MKIGDTAWEIEWTTDVPNDENGDAVIDGGTTHQQIVRTRDEAVARLRELETVDFFGCPVATPLVLRKSTIGPRCVWAYAGESIGLDELRQPMTI